MRLHLLLLSAFLAPACEKSDANERPDAGAADQAPDAAIPDAPEPVASRTAIVFAATLDGQTEPDLYTVEPDGSNLTRLTTTDAAELYPSWSPDHQRIAFIRDFQLFTVDGFGRRELLLAEHTGKERAIDGSVYSTTLGPAAWSPTGMQLAYLYPRDSNVIDGVDQAPATTIHFIRNDGANDHAIDIDPGFTVNSLSWPDAEIVSFSQADDCADCAGGQWYAIADTDGEPYHQLETDPVNADTPNKHLDWSHDGTRWTYVGGHDYFSYERPDAIYVAPSTGTGDPELIRDNGWNPRWSPDDNSIASIGVDGIYIVDADGGRPRRIVLGNIRGLDW